jgi:hypothetical protein
VAVGRCALVAALVAMGVLAALRQSGQVCRERWCWRPPTRSFQDGPNAVQFPTYHYCSACYARFLERRRELSSLSDPRQGKLLIGNQLFDRPPTMQAAAGGSQSRRCAGSDSKDGE